MWKDEDNRFGVVSVVLHWINAGFVIALLTIGLIVWPLPRVPERGELLYLHVSLAVLAFPFVVARISWRLRNGKPRTVNQPRLFKVAAEITWRALLAAITLQFITGPLLVWLHGRPIEFFGLFGIPTPFARMDMLHDDVIMPLHQTVAVTLALFLVLHVSGALKHLFYDRDRTVQKMIWPFREKTGSASNRYTTPEDRAADAQEVS